MIDYRHDLNIVPKKGDLLISEPFLPDPNFERTVILICEHNDDGTFGFILNKPSLMKFDEVLEDVENFPELLYVGGPVQQNTLHFIHRAEELIDDGAMITEGLFWGGNFNKLKILIEKGKVNPNDFRFFLGYSGWESGQLENELKENSWIISSLATPEKVFDQTTENLWRDVLKGMGGKYKMFSNFPEDPNMN